MDRSTTVSRPGHPARRRAASLIGAALIGAGLLLTPATAAAATNPTVQTTDPAGDAHDFLYPNVATADLLAAGATVNATTIVFFIDLTTAPTPAQLASGTYSYTSDLDLAQANGFNHGFDDIQTGIYTPYGGGTPSGYVGVRDSSQYDPENDPQVPPIVGALRIDAGTNELTVTVSRADLNARIAQLAALAHTPNRQLVAGDLLRVGGASAMAPSGRSYQAAGTDTAGVGPAVTFNG